MGGRGPDQAVQRPWKATTLEIGTPIDLIEDDDS